ncbi:hypothetical protein CC86DRAFT_122886 [Ophiobolus disseminans]|uniref:Uncharacterized protein n=1 Tax=Ophiobolus disseminans TaxID=1469910 RepID=A0A6A6ZFR0_9PLEO|nr:hypothetical protein CC86DRAFT_122886 [Ophiobolus disseminans]
MNPEPLISYRQREATQFTSGHEYLVNELRYPNYETTIWPKWWDPTSQHLDMKKIYITGYNAWHGEHVPDPFDDGYNPRRTFNIVWNDYGLMTIVCHDASFADDINTHTALRCSNCFGKLEDGNIKALRSFEVALHAEGSVTTSIHSWLRWRPVRAGVMLAVSKSETVLQNTCTCSNPSDVLRAAYSRALPTSGGGDQASARHPCDIVIDLNDESAFELDERDLGMIITARELTMTWTSFTVSTEMSNTPLAEQSPNQALRKPTVSNLWKRLAHFGSYLLYAGLILYSAAYSCANLDRFQKPRPNHSRIHWQCVCGDSLFGDYQAKSSSSLRVWEKTLHSLASDISHTSNENPPLGSRHPSTVSIGRVDQSSVPANSSAHTPGQSASNSLRSDYSQQTAATPKFARQDGWRRRYLELCVNTGTLKISLGELNLDPQQGVHLKVETDAQLFKMIHDRYFQIRKDRRLTFLYQPVDIQFIRFSVYDSGHVGIYEKPMSLPPVSDVKNGNYHYYDCPMEPLPPIDHRTFLHYFWNHDRHLGSTSNLFLNRLPKKLNLTMREQERLGHLNLGWGVHIIEGPNKKMISLCLFLIVLLSFAVSLSYSVATHAQESGFGIGQWIVATLAVGLSAVYFHVSE